MEVPQIHYLGRVVGVLVVMQRQMSMIPESGKNGRDPPHACDDRIVDVPDTIRRQSPTIGELRKNCRGATDSVH